MPLYEYRCEQGHTEEHVARVGTDSHLCSCGNQSKRVWSTFTLRSYAIDRSSWELVAPTDAEGRPLSIKEAARAGYDRYSPGAAEREARHQREQEVRLKRNRMESAKRDAWREVSRKNRVVV